MNITVFGTFCNICINLNDISKSTFLPACTRVHGCRSPAYGVTKGESVNGGNVYSGQVCREEDKVFSRARLTAFIRIIKLQQRPYLTSLPSNTLPNSNVRCSVLEQSLVLVLMNSEEKYI